MRRFLFITYILFFNSSIKSQIIPTDIAGLVHWYVADSIERDVNGSVEVVYDLSQNEDHLVQTNILNRPQYLDSIYYNRPVIRFNGVNQFVDVLFSELIVQSYTVFAVWSSSGGGNRVFLDNRTNHLLDTKTGNHVRIFSGVEVSYAKPSPFDYIITRAEFNGNSSKLFENNILKAEGSIGNGSLPGLTMGKRTIYNDRFFHGDFSQLLIFEGVLSEEQTNMVYSYLYNYYIKFVDLGGQVFQNDICDTVVLDAGNRFESYLWSDGSTAETLIVSAPGFYWVEVIDAFGHTSRDTVEVVTNFQYPSSNLYCQNDYIVWNPEINSEYNFLWSDGSSADTYIIDSPGSFYVTVTDTNGCTYESDTLYFSEDPYSTSASLGPDIDLCVGNQLGLSTGAEETISYLWSTGATTPEIPLSTSGEYSVIATNINGCEAKDTVQVNIIGSAPAIAYSIPELICLNSDAEFLDGSTSTDGSTINTWEWLFLSDTLTSNNGTWQADSVGVFDIHYTIGTTAGCFSDTTFTLTVKPLPIVTLQSQGVCQGDEIQFYAGQLTPTLIDTWEWNFGESGSEAYGAEVEYVFSGNGNIPITLIGTDIYGCSDTLVQEQTISPKPNAAFYYTDICAGEVVHFANQTTIDYPGQMASRQWNFGDGTTSGQNNPQKPYASYGEYPVSLTVVSADGCSDYAEVLLKVNALPQVNYTYQQACARSSTQFTDASFVPNGSVADVKWSFNGQPPLSGFSVANTFNFPGTVQLKQTVKSAFGCSNAKETYIPIGPEIYAALSFSPNAFVIDQPVIFSSEGSGETSYAWDFGNGIVPGSSDTTFIFTEDQIGEEVTVTLWVSNAVGCEDSSSVTRIVSGREVDLAIAEVFEYNSAGYSQLGVRLKNVGQAPIESVELSVHKSGFGTFKETWSGNLSPGTEEIYVFSASPAALTSYSSNFQDYLCISGRVLSAYLEEENLENNELCLNLTEDKEMIVVAIPNPIGDELRLRIISETDEVVDVAVFDAMGRKVAFLGEVVVGKGGDEVVVPAGHWAQGVYRVVVGEVRLVVVK